MSVLLSAIFPAPAAGSDPLGVVSGLSVLLPFLSCCTLGASPPAAVSDLLPWRSDLVGLLPGVDSCCRSCLSARSPRWWLGSLVWSPVQMVLRLLGFGLLPAGRFGWCSRLLAVYPPQLSLGMVCPSCCRAGSSPPAALLQNMPRTDGEPLPVASLDGSAVSLRSAAQTPPQSFRQGSARRSPAGVGVTMCDCVNSWTGIRPDVDTVSRCRPPGIAAALPRDPARSSRRYAPP